MKKERKLSFGNLLVIGGMLAISILVASCDKLEKLEPKSFADVFEGKIAGEWTVDSIKYTSFDVSKKQTSEIINPTDLSSIIKTG